MLPLPGGRRARPCSPISAPRSALSRVQVIGKMLIVFRHRPEAPPEQPKPAAKPSNPTKDIEENTVEAHADDPSNQSR
jgi:hypothetical protein